MNGYETVLILSAELQAAAQQTLLAKLVQLYAERGGKVISQVEWGKRKMAYSIAKQGHGVYAVLYLDTTPAALKALENQCRIEDGVLRWQSVKVKDVAAAEADLTRVKQAEKEANEAALAREASYSARAASRGARGDGTFVRRGPPDAAPRQAPLRQAPERPPAEGHRAAPHPSESPSRAGASSVRPPSAQEAPDANAQIETK